MRTSTPFLLALWAITATCLASTALAQEPSSRPERRWTFELGAAGISAYSAESVEQAMRAAGMAEATPAGCFIWCTDPIPHPRTYPSGHGSWIGVGYRVRPPFQIRAFMTGGPLGETHGYGAGKYLFVAARATSFALLGAAESGSRMLLLFAGPSLDHVRSASALAKGETYGSALTPGFWLGGQVKFPGRKRFYASFTVARHWADAVETGPVDVFHYDGSFLTTVRDFGIDASYTTVMFGVGMNW